jgi:hypothetical protein
MIHRDHRQADESSSALGQIIHQEAPREMTVGDLDLYVMKYRGNIANFKGLEHKNPNQAVGRMQAGVLQILDGLIQHAIVNPPDNIRLDPDSGIFIVRGALSEGEISKRVDFSGPQIVKRLDGSTALAPKSRKEFYDWLNGGPDWTPRGGRSRYGGNV